MCKIGLFLFILCLVSVIYDAPMWLKFYFNFNQWFYSYMRLHSLCGYFIASEITSSVEGSNQNQRMRFLLDQKKMTKAMTTITPKVIK
jgi:hypothetical protein